MQIRLLLLKIAGVTQIVISIILCIAMTFFSICFEMVHFQLKKYIYLTDLYAYNPELGNKLMILFVTLIFLAFSFCIFANFASGYWCYENAKIENYQAKVSTLEIVLAVLSFLTVVGIFASVLMFIAMFYNRQNNISYDQKYAIKLEYLNQQYKNKEMTSKVYKEKVKKLEQLKKEYEQDNIEE